MRKKNIFRKIWILFTITKLYQVNQHELLMMTRYRPINSAGEICVNKYLRLSVSHLHGFFRLHWRPFAPIYKLAQHEKSLIPQAFVKHLNSLFRKNTDQRHNVSMWRTEQTSSWVIYIFIKKETVFTEVLLSNVFIALLFLRIFLYRWQSLDYFW